MPTIKNFQDCLSEAVGKKHILLGNGFSRSCRDHIFSYQSLFDSADFQNLNDRARSLFTVLGTNDFEIIMKILKSAAKIGPTYNVPDNISELQEGDAQQLRSILIQTIARHHPELPSDITDAEYERCISFISNFEKIYTLNYDLLLYWTLMKRREHHSYDHDDGFRNPDEQIEEAPTEEKYVAWLDSLNQNVFYLHGALHLFHQKELLLKYCWNRTGIPLLNQIDSALASNKFPLIVSEGESRQKLERIQKSSYLGKCYRSINRITGNLFTFGFAFSENDKHITNQIGKNRSIKKMYVGIFGDPGLASNLEIFAHADSLIAARPPTKPLIVEYYDASTARVWR